MKNLMLALGTVFMLSAAFVATQDCCPQGIQCDTQVCCAGDTACCSLED